jgi:2-polyprenyl-3-methyl-5-hydroxy-6-metoxy-1,4-benzoquinol methylase
MAKYHKYVFDVENRKFIGDFESMYQNEAIEQFDSWHQEDTRQFHRNVIELLLHNYNFNCIVDIGCGKGAFTHTLKKENNKVIGIDIAPTAVKLAKEKFTDIDFIATDVNEQGVLTNFFKSLKQEVDLVVVMEVLSYCSNWKDIIACCASHSSTIMLSSFIPDNPIGFIKTADELLNELNKYYKPIEIVKLTKIPFTIYFGENKLKE